MGRSMPNRTRSPDCVDRRGDGLSVPAFGHVQIDHRRGDVAVAKQLLKRSDVIAPGTCWRGRQCDAGGSDETERRASLPAIEAHRRRY
jgi:hypothetical protein